ncbi:MAG: hypothetical protein ABSD21_04835 [Rhizomicrobium sp.]|jgi:hypothetical protein
MSAVVPDEDPSPARSDEEFRRLAAERLTEYLEMGASLMARCEHLAELPKGDRLGPLYAAARLMRANALVAQALANVVQVERRQRSIVERIQSPDPKIAELNSKIKMEGEEDARERLERRLDALLEQANAAYPGETNEGDGVGEPVEHEEEEIARLNRQAGENAG